jgi:hypothetical protein
LHHTAHPGYAALAGCGLLVLLIPIQTKFSHMFATTRKATARVTDERVKVASRPVTCSFSEAFLDIKP